VTSREKIPFLLDHFFPWLRGIAAAVPLLDSTWPALAFAIVAGGLLKQEMN
jgi:hypothetical protein